MNNEAMFAVFPELDEAMQQEAEQRWGGTTGWKQSAERTKGYKKADWLHLKEEMARTCGEAKRVFRSGAAAASPEAIACAEADRLMIQHWFYDCPRTMHAAVKEGTSQDPRFVANIDRNCPGLAVWLAEAAAANLKCNRDRDTQP